MIPVLRALFISSCLFSTLTLFTNEQSVKSFLQELTNNPLLHKSSPKDIINFYNKEFALTMHDKSIYPFTPLMVFAYTNNIQLAQELVAKSSNKKNAVTIHNAKGVTPLMIAAQNGFLRMVKFLLKSGANPNAIDLQGNTALHYAAHANQKDIIELLLGYGASAAQPNKAGKIPAFVTKDTEIKKLLAVWHAYQISKDFIKAIAGDTAKTIPSGLTANIANLVVPFKLKVHGVYEDVSFTPLMVAAFKGNYDLVKQLLNLGASPEIANDEGTTALTVACNFGDTKIASLLLEYGSDINKQDSFGMSCLMYASLRNHGALVQELLQKGANTALTNDEGLRADQLSPTKRETKRTQPIKQKLEELFFQKHKPFVQQKEVRALNQKNLIEGLKQLRILLIALKARL